jgi:DNA primase catalytic core
MKDLKALKMRVDLAAVVQAHGVPLKRKGANLVAPCPFHREKTPSFTVNERKRIWKCFGCGAAGDVFTFLQKKAGLSIPAAVEYVQRMVPQPPPPPAPPAAPTVATPQAHVAGWASADVLDRVVTHWQHALGTSRRAQTYVRGRSLWHPELLRAFRVGYSCGKLAQVVPADTAVRRSLAKAGVLNARGNEFFYNRLVVPLFDASGALVNVYGRTLAPASEVPHLYLPGPRRGVFNRVGIADAAQVVLTESILDALSLVVLGFSNTTAAFGVNGFTADLRAMLARAKTRRVYCAYDADPAGDTAADQLAHDLAGHGIEVLRVVLPAKDPNDFIKGGGTAPAFQALLDAARPLEAPRPSSAAPPRQRPPEATAPVPSPPTPPAIPASTAPEPATGPCSSTLELTLGDRTYQIEGQPTAGPGALRVVLRVVRGDRSFVDTLNLYSDRARAALVSRLGTMFRGQVPKKVLEEDVFALIDDVERLVARAASTPAPIGPTMSGIERDEALAFLARPDVIDAILSDLVRLGVVGEADNKLLAYLVATSRKLGRPLSLSVISQASAGKSWLLNVVLDLMPPEDVLRYTRMSPRALFYVEAGRYKHKILFIEEAIGAKDADLGVRSMQSEKRLANLVTMTDPKTGQLTTQETVVEGPLTYITSSVEQLDYETATRSFEIAIDESTDQTARVVARQFYERTLEGIQEKLTSDAILARHRNAQRLVEPLVVVNPYAPQLTFPSGTLRTRRECGKYLSLMDALALLHQHQRPVKTFERAGQTYRYTEVAREDVDRANRLMASCLVRALSDLTGPAEKLLLAIRDYVTAEAEARGTDPLAISFSRRQIRECLNWSDHQAVPVLEELTRREYVEAVSGSFGKRYVYTLTPDHQLLVRAEQTIEERIVALGLKPMRELVDPALFRIQSDLPGKR